MHLRKLFVNFCKIFFSPQNKFQFQRAMYAVVGENTDKYCRHDNKPLNTLKIDGQDKRQTTFDYGTIRRQVSGAV